MTSKLLKVFLLLAILAIVVVNADGNSNDTSNTDETNVIDQCIKKNNCAPDDRPCRSACAGVPYPDPKVANETHDCYEKCYNDFLANSKNDVNGYTKCTQDCKTNVYQQGITEPGSSVPSSGASNGGNSDNSGNGGQDNGSSNSSDNSSGTDSNSTKNETGAASFTTGSASYVYVFTTIFACVVFGVGL